MSEVKQSRGGKRVGAGRKKIDKTVLEQILLDELIFPAVCAAFHADPGKWQERILTFQLSSNQIRSAYGAAGLKEWKTYFTAIKKGGCDRFGQGFDTLWRFNTVKYGFVLKLVQALGHDIKDLPQPGFPPVAMLARLERIEQRRNNRKARNEK